MAPTSTTSAAGSPVQRMKDLVLRLTPMQKIASGAVIITVVAGGLILSRTSSTAAMAPLYTDLAAADAASVVDSLASQGVAYDLTDAGRTVLVPKDQVYDLRVSMAAEGLPTSNEGYALLDDQGITTSEFRQRIDYQRALEGELAKTLSALAGVASASVHLALPDDSVFIDEPATPTASVLVAARGLDGISSSEVESIVHLVASSVKDMKPADVTVIDANGSVLSAGGGAAAGGVGGSDRAKQVADFESRMNASIMALLTRMTGPSKVSVKVTADLDLDQVQTTSEDFEQIGEEGGAADGTKGPVLSEKVISEEYGAGLAAESDATGVLGPDGVIGTGDETAEATGTRDYSKEQADRQYALDRTVEQTVVVPGTVKRLNVAVLVDDETVTEEQKAQIEEMVAIAAGIDQERGDRVTVTRMPFDTSAVEAAGELVATEEAAQSREQMMNMIRTVAVLLVIIVALFLGYRSAKNARRVTTVPIQLGEITAAPRPSLVAAGAPMAGPDTYDQPTINLNRAPDKDEMVLHELTTMADRKPQEVAEVLRTWLSENKGR